MVNMSAHSRADIPNYNMPKTDTPVEGKKRRVNSKSKGNGFEGTVAKKLSAALAPLNFIRTPGSGARVGGKNFETIGKMFGEDALKIFVGDVVPVNERQEKLKFLHSVETKFYKTPDSFTALASGTANVLKWFGEAIDDASKISKNPMLIFKWNHTPVYVAVDSNHDKINMAPLVAAGLKPCFTLLTYGEGAKALDIYLLDDLLPHRDFWVEVV